MIELILAAVTGLLAGIIATLKAVAPRTKTQKDDKVLELAEKAHKVVEQLAKTKTEPTKETK